jgi:hypothetical protein
MIKLFSLKNTTFFFIVTAITTLFFLSCKKNGSDGGTTVNPSTPPDLTSIVNSALVSGFVTDENEAAVKSATVQIGTTLVTTDKYGYFEARNVSVIKNAATVSVTKAGYFKSIKTYIATADKSVFFRIKMIPKTNAGNVNGASGGTVTLSNGMAINFPAASVVNAATNAAYTGTVNVAAYWINPTSADLPRIMPGDLRGLNTDGNLQLLTTYGMAAVDLTGTGGELLQIAAGKKATLTMPIPAALLGSAPASIPLWYFDETKGLWKQEGAATKTGSNYVGEVSHFSFWNYDVPANYIQFNCTIVNQNGQPLQHALVKITVISNPANNAFGYTDSSGYISGAVPNNSQLLMEVFGNNGCISPLYSQSFTTTNTNISLGTITVNAISLQATVSGTATTCSSIPVTNGYIILKSGNITYRYPITNGTFNFNILLCSSPAIVSIIAEDVTNLQQSNGANYTLNTGNNTLGNIQACGITVQQFITYTINGTTYNFSAPADTLSSNRDNLNIYLSASNKTYTSGTSLSFKSTGIAAGSTQALNSFVATQIPDSMRMLTPINVNITEYGTVGQYIGGNFTGTFTGASPANIPFNTTCTFRFRRYN